MYDDFCPESSLQWQWSIRGNRLELGPLSLSHAGMYTCMAKNSEGQTRKDYSLTVQGKNPDRFHSRDSNTDGSLSLAVSPTILDSGHPAEVSVAVGEELTLECKATGIPAPQLSWLKDGVALESSDSRHIA